MNRPIWGTLSAVMNWIGGVLTVLSGMAMIIGGGFAFDAVRQISFIIDLPILQSGPIIIIVAGILSLVLGGLGCAAGYGLMAMQNWARITAVVLHILFALNHLGSTVILIQADLLGLAILPVLLFLMNVTLAVGLLLSGTAAAYSNQGGGFSGAGGGRITQVAPGYAGGGGGFSPGLPPTQGITGGQFQQPQFQQPQFQQQAAQPVAATVGAVPPQPQRVNKTEVAGPPQPQVLAWLVERTGPRPGTEHRLAAQVTLGRDPARCEIILDDGKVSGEHARIKFEQGQFVIIDLGSTNHTYVNGQEVQKHALKDGDQVKLGPNVTLTFMRAGR